MLWLQQCLINCPPVITIFVIFYVVWLPFLVMGGKHDYCFTHILRRTGPKFRAQFRLHCLCFTFHTRHFAWDMCRDTAMNGKKYTEIQQELINSLYTGDVESVWSVCWSLGFLRCFIRTVSSTLVRQLTNGRSDCPIYLRTSWWRLGWGQNPGMVQNSKKRSCKNETAELCTFL